MAANQIRQYRRGNRVEVSIPEEGFEASFFSVVVVHRIPLSYHVMVQFCTLLNEAQTQPLCLAVHRVYVRPMSIQVVVSDFAVGDVVDAHDRDGWWTGKVHSKTGVDLFEVFFPTTGEILPYRFADLRVHQRYNHLAREWTFKKEELEDEEMEEAAIALN